MLLAAVAALAGASIQSATGFGFALVLSPALFAALEPAEALTTVIVLGLALNLLVLTEPRAPRLAPVARSLAPVLLAALPGLGVGLALLVLLDKPMLQVAVGLAVLGAALVQIRSRRRRGRRSEPSRASAYVAGLATGVLTTSTSVSGPPLVLWLEARGAEPGEMRASLSLSFLALNLVGGALVLAASGLGALRADVVLPLLALVGLGHAAGARVFRRLDAERMYAVALVLVVASGATSVAAGLAGL